MFRWYILLNTVCNCELLYVLLLEILFSFWSKFSDQILWKTARSCQTRVSTTDKKIYFAVQFIQVIVIVINFQNIFTHTLFFVETWQLVSSLQFRLFSSRYVGQNNFKFPLKNKIYLEERKLFITFLKLFL